MIEELEKSGYKKFKSIFHKDSINYQKKIIDDTGTKYFINVYIYQNDMIGDGLQYEVQFHHKNDTTEDLKLFHTNKYNLKDIEKIIEKRFIDGGFVYYELN